VPEILANLSASYRLMPGDLVMTGTPAGVGPVRPGETMRGAVVGVGEVVVTVGTEEA
jgi:fumarylpyruvate hydrolase